MNVVIAVFMALALVFGGGAATVQASQDDLPNQALYPVKLLVEDVRLWLTNDPEDEVSLLMEMVQTRVKELNMLASGGIVPPGEVTLRLEQQIRQALQVAAGLDRGDGQALLLQIRSQLEIQQQAMLHGEGEAAQIMTQTRTMLQEQLLLVDEGLVDPQHFQEMFRGEEQEPNRTGQGADSSPVPGDGGNGEGSPAGTGNPTAGPHSPGSPGSGPQATPGGQGGGNRP